MNLLHTLLLIGLLAQPTTSEISMFEWIALGQKRHSTTANAKQVLQDLDAPAVWQATSHAAVYGIIGNKHQRIRMVFTKAEQSRKNPAIVNIQGVSSVNGNLGHFRGTLTIDSVARLHPPNHPDVKKRKGPESYVLMGSYAFSENTSQFHSGVFEGQFWTKVYRDAKGRFVLDKRMHWSDSYLNNAFVGTWTIHDGSLSMLCNWGDYRVPQCADDFDIGVSRLIVADKYHGHGWQTYMDAILNENEIAQKQEYEVWWK